MRNRRIAIAFFVGLVLSVSLLNGGENEVGPIDPACEHWKGLPDSVRKIIPPPPNCTIEDVDPFFTSSDDDA